MGIYDWLRGKKSYQSVHNSGQSWNSIFVAEPYSGAWQENKEITREDMTAFYAVFACVSLISKDIGKMPVLLKKKQQGVLVDALTPKELQRVLQKPNNYQNWQQFNEQWTQSLLLRGNTYVFKMRDVFGELYRLVVLNPDLVTVLVDDQGNVFYQLTNDRLAQTENVIIPASEIIHDRINALYHPLVGLTPIMACSLASEQGISILRNSKNFFANGSKPGGVIEVPGPLDATKAQEVKTKWDANYSGANVGKTGLLSDGAKYVNISMSAIDSQLIEQLGMSARIVCTAFNVPPFKIGVTDVQGATKVSDLNEIYYSDCLQSYIEARENLLDEGLDLPSYGVEAFLDLDVLIRMDSSSKIAYFKDGISAGIFAPNEARQKLGYLPVKGGESPYLQQQNYNLEALAKRDAKDDPFTKNDSSSNQSDNSLKSLYKGVFKDDVQYQKGQFITKNGSLWHVENDHLGEFDHKNFKLCAKEWTE
ncbi:MULTISPECIES: phage portal protein [Acinetobacter]|uniref:HK97 family phage portal protein n=3 Tax=Acinetobacter TaxID=469 RepID=N9DFG9_9GAMM|nr:MULTISPECIES: phage portal protein [Acinetobacter]ENV79505.1 HK97 family phage portal protein [Acinetobacter ursingii ANC 3649]PZT87764.1 MAG: phage portal protein [Acinetobacter sp.]QXZ23280.1 phage portal protein [Acinetobacter septicus]